MREKRKYIFVNAEEIIKRTHCECSDADDGWRSYHSFVVDESALVDFKENEVPEEYRTIIIDAGKLHINGLRYGEEYLTKKPFISLVNTEDYKTICGHTEASNDSKIEFETFREYKSHEDVVKFFGELKEKGILDNYVNAVTGFIMNVSFDRDMYEKGMKKVDAAVRTRGKSIK